MWFLNNAIAIFFEHKTRYVTQTWSACTLHSQSDRRCNLTKQIKKKYTKFVKRFNWHYKNCTNSTNIQFHNVFVQFFLSLASEKEMHLYYRNKSQQTPFIISIIILHIYIVFTISHRNFISICSFFIAILLLCM